MLSTIAVHFLPTLTSAEELAAGVVVMVDVLRASTTIVTALANGAKEVIPCLEIDEARQKAAEWTGSGESSERPLLGGERGGLAIAGFDRDTYRRLAPYVTVLPAGTKLNVNTASDVVLASLSDNIDLGIAASLIEQRADAEFIDINATFEGLVEPDVLQELDGVSDHFLLTATVTLGSNQLTMRSVLQRDRSGITRAVFRSLGVE